MKIDAYTHIVPPKYKQALYKKAPSISYVGKFVDAFPTLTDLDVRFRIIVDRQR